MKILITWASWFIWKNLILHLKNSWNDCFWLIRNSSSFSFFIENKIKFFSFQNFNHIYDFCNTEKFDLIIHLATLYPSWNTLDDISSLIDSNITFWTKILEIAYLTWVKNFINTSSFFQNYENHIYSPVNMYAATKQAFEDIWQYYSDSGKLKFLSLSLVNTYWPNDERKKIFNIWKDSLKNKEIVKSTSWEQFIDILYISDVVNAYLCLINYIESSWEKHLNMEKYALKSSEILTLKDLAWLFEEIVWTKLKIEWWVIPYREREMMYPYNLGKNVPWWKQQVSLKEWIKLFLDI